MASPIADYAVIGNTRTAALVGRDGSIDWMCAPRFDSAACFSALLGDRSHGRWLVAPSDDYTVDRSYRGDTVVLDTEFTTATGRVRLTDCMVPDPEQTTLVRLVTGLSGRVGMRSDFVLRFDYGSIVPWVRHDDEGVHAVGGPDAVVLRSPIRMHGRDYGTEGEFEVAAGEQIGFVLTHHASHLPAPAAVDAASAVERATTWWADWMAQSPAAASASAPVRRSLLTLKALTYAPTGGIVAAATTSLPEEPGGVRNWDYRFCWLRDATFTLYALMLSGFESEALAWREWLLRAAAGRPQDLQILYGLSGERRVDETELPWLPGYGGARPVRVGNAARGQFQLDVYGEVFDALHVARRFDGGASEPEGVWELQRVLLDFLESEWSRPDSSLWEVRGPARDFTHSKVMAWVGFDRAVKAVERFGRTGPVDRWRAVRDDIHREVCRRGYDPDRGTFVQAYGSDRLDAALLMLPLVGFLPAEDPRMRGTVRAVERELLHEGFVLRYRPDEAVDGLPGGEGVFLPCSFWLADNYVLQGRDDEGRALFDRLVDLSNDVGLLSEEYDPISGDLLGNLPQAFTHVALVNTAHNLSAGGGAAHHRSGEGASRSTA